MGTAHITVEHVTKQYGRGRNAVAAIRDLSLCVERGQFVSIMGTSGSGKSTLLNLIAGLDMPTSGSITVDGDDLAHLSEERRSDLRLQHMGIVFQAFNLFPSFTVEENVTWPLELLGTRWRTAQPRGAAALERVGIPRSAWARRPAELSGGEQQRVAIARALVAEPSLLLADEPTGNLDSRTGEMILDLLRDLNVERRLTVVLVTHSAFAATYGHRTVELSDGRIVHEARVPQDSEPLRVVPSARPDGLDGPRPGTFGTIGAHAAQSRTAARSFGVPLFQVLRWLREPLEFWTSAPDATATASRSGWPAAHPSSFSHIRKPCGIVTGDPAVFRAGAANLALAPVLGQQSLLLLDGYRHRHMRRLLMPALYGEAVSVWRTHHCDHRSGARRMAARRVVLAAHRAAETQPRCDPARRLRSRRGGAERRRTADTGPLGTHRTSVRPNDPSLPAGTARRSAEASCSPAAANRPDPPHSSRSSAR